MKDRIEKILKNARIPYKNVTILGFYIHIELYGEESANKTATLFPKSDYTCRVFKSIVSGNWKCVAKVR